MTSEHILGRHTAELNEQGTLILYGPGMRMALPYDEAYALLMWLYENHRETLYQLAHEEQEPWQSHATKEEGLGDDYAF
jgi:hypothetical protein